MVDVGGKSVTQREAEAEGFVLLTRDIAEAIKSGKVPKGDVFRVAELAGIMAAKRVPGLIPLCHAIRLNHAKVICELDDLRERVRVSCAVKSDEVTGVEMEALTGVSVACLTIYDMCKGIDKGMSIEGVRLLRKSGGKSGDYSINPHAQFAKLRMDLAVQDDVKANENEERKIRAGVLTVSDKGAIGERVDTAGPGLAALLEKFGASVELTRVVPDERDKIADVLSDWADDKKLELILTTGGTGLSPRDVTPEALMEVGDRVVPGFGEHMRAQSISQTPHGILSRGLAVTRRSTLIIALPGSERGSRQCFEWIEPALCHAVEILNKRKAECGGS